MSCIYGLGGFQNIEWDPSNFLSTPPPPPKKKKKKKQTSGLIVWLNQDPHILGPLMGEPQCRMSILRKALSLIFHNHVTCRIEVKAMSHVTI